MNYKYIDEKGEHLHVLDEQPLYGTSSVANVLGKPLAYWASGLAVKEFGVPDSKVLTKIKNKKNTPQELEALNLSLEGRLNEIKQMSTEEYLKLCDRAYRAHASTLKSKAKEGVNLHAELERFVKDEMAGANKDINEYEAKIHSLIKWSRENVKTHLWSEVNCFSSVNWTGGISDWGVELNNGEIAVVDFKSSKEAYLSQFWQACGYAIQIEENGGYDKDGNKTFELQEGKKVSQVIIVPFGAEGEVVPQINVDVAGGKEAFLAMLLLYKKLPRD
jgi:hypothetical protein